MRPTLFHRALGALLAMAVAASVAFSGQTMLWCPWMKQVMSQCCCDHAEDRPASEASLSQAGCCETRVIPAVPTANAESRSLTIRPATSTDVVLAVLPGRQAELNPSSVSVAGRTRERGARAGPDTAIHRLNCVYLI